MTMDISAVEKAVEGIFAQEAAELVDLNYLQEHGRWVLRFFVDKEGGVKIADCEKLSKRLGAILDTMEDMPSRYCLEVSSPGLNRIIKKEKDFLRFSGERIRLRVKAPIGGQRRFTGILKGFESGAVQLENGGEITRFDLHTVEEARLDPEIRI